MIKLGYSREQMLADIHASEGVLANGSIEPPSLANLTTQEQSHLRIRGKTEEELLPGLRTALSTRFSDVPPVRLRNDLLKLLDRALGNADKRGNQGDSNKWITVEVIVTREGAFIEITDEGPGFDFAGTFEKFKAGVRYFSNRGGGFRRYHRTRSIVSFANGGCTFRARYLRGPSSAP